jgi:uncharacterized protein (AIM24 family)
MTQWFLSYDGKQFGPFDLTQASARVLKNPNGYAWRDGFAGWQPISSVTELTPPVPIAPMPPPGSAPLKSDEIDFKVVGNEMQFVEIELDPGESAVAEAGAMMYKSSRMDMQTIFGDGSSQGGGSFMDKLMGAGKRLLTGASLFMTVFTNRGQGKSHVAFGAPYPGNIVPVRLKDIGGTLICQKDSFLCAAKGVSVGIYFQRRILTGLFGGEGFIMQKLDEVLHVDTGCVVAFEPSIQFDIQQADGVKTALFGGEGLFFATLQGPGKIWLQSLPFSRLAGRMLAAAPQRGGSRGEGSILGSLGGLLDGDNDY